MTRANPGLGNPALRNPPEEIAGSDTGPGSGSMGKALPAEQPGPGRLSSGCSDTPKGFGLLCGLGPGKDDFTDRPGNHDQEYKGTGFGEEILADSINGGSKRDCPDNYTEIAAIPAETGTRAHG